MTDQPVPAEAPEVFPPTLREVMLRGRWIAMLALCLVVAGVFAWLGQWQLGRAIDTAPREAGATEQVEPIAEIATPGEYLAEPLIGQRVDVSGRWVDDDFIVVASRFNDGAEGYWVTGQLRVDAASTGMPDAAVSLAAAIGWAATAEEADAAAAALAASVDPDATVSLTGRLVGDEGVALPPREEPMLLERMSPAALLPRWHDTAELDVYRQYLVADVSDAQLAQAGLEPISSPAPDEGSNVNWLNIFYAVEWAIFAGFAFYLWYRLARDAWEREVEDLLDPDPGPATGA